MTRQHWVNHAHKDPSAKFLAHQDVQPIQRWSERLAAGFACFLIGFLAVVVVVVR